MAAACVAVIAGVGFYFYSAYADAQRLAEYQKQEAVRRGCIAAIGQNMPALKQFCVDKGYITAAQAAQ